MIVRSFKLAGSFVKRFFINPPIPKNEDGRVMVHIGCGEMNDHRYINVDARPLAHVHHVTKNIDDLWFFPNKSVDLVYMCHAMEHFDRRQVIGVIDEVFRVLKVGGIFRVSVPNFDMILKIYQENNNNIDLILAPLFGGQDYAFNYHYNAFNERSLSALFLGRRFSSTRIWDPKQSSEYSFDDWASKEITVGGVGYPISLNIEAVK